MTIKTAPRARLLSSTSLFPMLRGPNVAYAPDEPEGGAADPEPADDTPEEFREQPGDREPEPDAGEEAAEEAVEEPEPEAEAEEEEPAEEPEAAADGETEAASEAPKKDWRDRQIAKLRDQQRQREEELAEAKRRAEAAEALLALPPEERNASLTEAQREAIRKEEAEKLEQKAYYTRINQNLETMYDAGKAAFASTWETRVKQAAEVFSDELRSRPDFLEAVTELPNAAAVYHELAGDPDKMEAVLKLPPHKMGIELANLSAKVAKPASKPVSKVPAPIKPLDVRGAERTLEELLNDPNASMAEIDRRMNAEEAKRAKAH